MTQKKLYLQKKKRYLKKIVGTQQKPRLSVYRSNLHIYAQLIDDKAGITLVSASTLQSKNIKNSATKDGAFKIGNELAEHALKKEIKTIVFDRGDRPYQGRIKSLAEGARESGLIF